MPPLPMAAAACDIDTDEAARPRSGALERARTGVVVAIEGGEPGPLLSGTDPGRRLEEESAGADALVAADAGCCCCCIGVLCNPEAWWWPGWPGWAGDAAIELALAAAGAASRAGDLSCGRPDALPPPAHRGDDDDEGSPGGVALPPSRVKGEACAADGGCGAVAPPTLDAEVARSVRPGDAVATVSAAAPTAASTSGAAPPLELLRLLLLPAAASGAGGAPAAASLMSSSAGATLLACTGGCAVAA